MNDGSDEIGNVSTFLENEAGTYRYRPWFTRTVMAFGFVCLAGFPIAVYDLLSEHPNSLYARIKVAVLVVSGPYLIWSCFVVAHKFKEIKIDAKGIRILPFGLHIAPHEIAKVHHSQNHAGAGTIELKLKTPYFIYHLVAWSWRNTVTIAFNKRLLTPVVTSA
ncbi:MAG: hypothetical protein V2I76_12955 [Roseobacter sp.]|nr:hypothetical protein [Roseobacter sp.]